VFERAARSGGKMSEVEVTGARIDAGPTVLTMRWVFDAVFEKPGIG
jgi:1-hydroxycarotenoid 3,4-desaturase